MSWRGPRGGGARDPAAPKRNYGPNFESIRKNFFIPAANFPSFDSGMSAGKHGAADRAEWYVQPDHGRRFGRGLYASHAGFEDKRANSLALIVTTSLLFVLFASAVMVGGHAIISPLEREPAVVGNSNDHGDIVYTMPDGTYCQHMTFDNATGRITSAGINHCDPDLDSGGGGFSTGFKWDSP
jgi:hypothetical protein